VLYGGQRKIKTSLVKQALIDKDDNALHELHQNILLRKASAWKYEKEWRLLGPVGIHDSPLRLSEITFGLRCDPSIVLAIVKVLEHRDVNFYQIEQIPGSFTLKRAAIDICEVKSTYPRIAESFEEVKLDKILFPEA
jgi:hypothetical protein